MEASRRWFPQSRHVGRLLVVPLIALALAACDDGSERARPTAVAGASRVRLSQVTDGATPPVHIDIFAPEQNDIAGIGGAGWFIDIAIDFPNTFSLSQTGFTAFQVTGPLGHNNIPPWPGVSAPGKDDRLPGLVVLCSTSKIGAGPGQNLANLFNLTGVTNRDASEIELWDTWLIGAPVCGAGTRSTLFLAMVADTNQDGILNDAPDVVPDANGDGRIDASDVKALGIISNLVVVEFTIAP